MRKCTWTNPFLAGGLRAFSVQVKEVDIRTSLLVSGTSNSMKIKRALFPQAEKRERAVATGK